jgi:superoxide dismutase, Cu-Zn family
MTVQKTQSLFVGCCAALLTACNAGDPQGSVRGAMPALEASDGGLVSAATVLHDASGHCVGRVTFSSADDTTLVEISAHLPAGQGGVHAIHIHANDNPDNGQGCIADPAEAPSTFFVSADGHFNPSAETHGHHAGDLPALFVTDAGEASLRFVTDRFHVEDIVGAAVILHQLPDNYGNIPVGENPDQYTPNSPTASDLTARTGNAGARIACGVIE